MEHSKHTNPLQKYFRQFKTYLKLPSGTSYYAKDVIEFNDMNELGIMPMTGKDELILKNPDALLNGEALIEVIKSCVPAVKDPRVLLTNDIDALITAVRYATFNDSLETTLFCPSCGAENSYKLDLQYALDNMEYLDDEYVANLDSGVSVYVKPYAFPEILKNLHAKFEQGKLSRAIEGTDMSEEQRSQVFAKAFEKMSVLTFELMLNSIIKVVDEENDINVNSKAYINEFLYNIDKKSVDKISDLINEINEIGIKKTFVAKCEKCGHDWESAIDFNPVNFS
jgi:rubrerythrin